MTSKKQLQLLWRKGGRRSVGASKPSSYASETTRRQKKSEAVNSGEGDVDFFFSINSPNDVKNIRGIKHAAGKLEKTSMHSLIENFRLDLMKKRIRIFRIMRSARK